MKTNLQAGNGWTWISKAIDLNKKQPAVFPVMGLILAAIANVPFIGGLVILILGPALIGGTMYAAHLASTGGQPAIGNLFQGFQDGDRVGSMVALCLPAVVAILVIGVLFFIFAVGAAVGGGFSAAEAGNPMALLAAMGMSAVIFAPIAIALMLVAWAMTYFAIPRVLLDGEGAFDAMKQSFAAAKSNAGAFLVALLLIMLGAIVLSLLLVQVLHLGWIGSLVVGTAMYAIAGPTFYFGYRAIFGAGDEAAVDASTSPQAPPPPPPPAETAPPPPPPTA